MDDSTNRAFVLECPDGGYEAQQSSVGTCIVFVIDIRSGALVTKSQVDTANQTSAQAIAVDTRLGRVFVLTQAGTFNNGAYPAGPSGAGTLSGLMPVAGICCIRCGRAEGLQEW